MKKKREIGELLSKEKKEKRGKKKRKEKEREIGKLKVMVSLN